MRIWTTQTKQLWEALKRDGFVTCCDSLISRAFSEYTLWEAGPLSGLYLPQGMKDEDCDDPALRRASWEIIFNIDAQTRFSPRKRRNKLIQACFWEIKMDWVERAVPFHHAGF